METTHSVARTIYSSLTGRDTTSIRNVPVEVEKTIKTSSVYSERLQRILEISQIIHPCYFHQMKRSWLLKHPSICGNQEEGAFNIRQLDLQRPTLRNPQDHGRVS